MSQSLTFEVASTKRDSRSLRMVFVYCLSVFTVKLQAQNRPRKYDAIKNWDQESLSCGLELYLLLIGKSYYPTSINILKQNLLSFLAEQAVSSEYRKAHEFPRAQKKVLQGRANLGPEMVA